MYSLEFTRDFMEIHRDSMVMTRDFTTNNGDSLMGIALW